MEKLNIKEFLDQDERKDLLRLLTAGSVDDGKSTLIGRLLFDSKKLYEDQLDALERYRHHDSALYRIYPDRAPLFSQDGGGLS